VNRAVLPALHGRRIRVRPRRMTDEPRYARRGPRPAVAALSDLEEQRYTRLTWTCALCQWVCSQGLRLMRIRRQSTASSTITTIAATLRCPKCRHAPDPAAITPSRDRGRCQPSTGRSGIARTLRIRPQRTWPARICRVSLFSSPRSRRRASSDSSVRQLSASNLILTRRTRRKAFRRPADRAGAIATRAHSSILEGPRNVFWHRDDQRIRRRHLSAELHHRVRQACLLDAGVVEGNRARSAISNVIPSGRREATDRRAPVL
jgi:hypothetical protein